MNLRKMLLKVLNGVPQEYHDKQMERAAKTNSLLQRTLFSYEADNLAKYEEIERHGQMLLEQSNQIEELNKNLIRLEAQNDLAKVILGQLKVGGRKND